jgi:hypothetical protein
MSSWEEGVSWTRDALLVCESAPDLVCKVLESEKGGTELVDSAVEGQSLPRSRFLYVGDREVESVINV